MEAGVIPRHYDERGWARRQHWWWWPAFVAVLVTAAVLLVLAPLSLWSPLLLVAACFTLMGLMRRQAFRTSDLWDEEHR